MKILITGASGMLGRHLGEYAPQWTNNPIGITFSSRQGGLMHLDLTREMDIHRMFSDHKPDVIIHCAALGNVDYAEQFPMFANKMNCEMTQRLIEIGCSHNPLFIYISSNAVYSGGKPPYNEADPQNPINVYGRTKKRAEMIVRSFSKNYIIIRPFMLFGYAWAHSRSNWYKILFKACKTEKQMKLINNIFWQPTSAGWAAETIWKLIDLHYRPGELIQEEYNLSQGESMSLWQFGRIVQRVFNRTQGKRVELFQPIAANNFQTIAPRPIDTRYDISKLKSIIGDDIPRVEDEIYNLM